MNSSSQQQRLSIGFTGATTGIYSMPNGRRQLAEYLKGGTEVLTRSDLRRDHSWNIAAQYPCQTMQVSNMHAGLKRAYILKALLQYILIQGVSPGS